MPDPQKPLTTVESRRRDNPLAGIAFKVSSVCTFLAMSALVKAAGEGIPAGQIVFFRAFFAIIPIMIVLLYRREFIEGLKTRQPIGHLWRGLVGAGGMMFGFYALTKLPLPEAVALSYATPLLIVVFGAIFLGETVRMYRWSAVIVGMIGVGIILWPRMTVFTGGGGAAGHDLAIGALAALAGCVFAAFAMLLVRRLVHSERSSTIVLYASITSTVIALMSLPFGWVPLTTTQTLMLVGAGIAGGVGQILMTEAFRNADVSVVAPFEYVSLILSIAVGFLVFQDVPTTEMLIGGAIVVAAGIFIILREHALGIERRSAKEVSPPSPG